MYPNAKGSELLSILATLDPVSQAVGTVTTGWISVTNFHALMVVLQTGALGAAATVDAKLQQALDAAGTGVKDITGRAIVQFTQVGAGSAKQAIINLKPEDLDTATGVYTFNTADNTKQVLIDYLYNATTGGSKITLGNALMGNTPTFMGVFTAQVGGKTNTLKLNACTSSKLALATKLEDYTIPELDFTAMADTTGSLGIFSVAD